MSLLENKKVPEAREQVSFLQDFSVPMICKCAPRLLQEANSAWQMCACECVCPAFLLSRSHAVSKPCQVPLHLSLSGPCPVLCCLPPGLWQQPPSRSPTGPTIHGPQRWASRNPRGIQSLKKFLFPSETAHSVRNCHPMATEGTCPEVKATRHHRQQSCWQNEPSPSMPLLVPCYQPGKGPKGPLELGAHHCMTKPAQVDIPVICKPKASKLYGLC